MNDTRLKRPRLSEVVRVIKNLGGPEAAAMAINRNVSAVKMWYSGHRSIMAEPWRLLLNAAPPEKSELGLPTLEQLREKIFSLGGISGTHEASGFSVEVVTEWKSGRIDICVESWNKLKAVQPAVPEEIRKSTELEKLVSDLGGTKKVSEIVRCGSRIVSGWFRKSRTPARATIKLLKLSVENGSAFNAVNYTHPKGDDVKKIIKYFGGAKQVAKIIDTTTSENIRKWQSLSFPLWAAMCEYDIEKMNKFSKIAKKLKIGV